MIRYIKILLFVFISVYGFGKTIVNSSDIDKQQQFSLLDYISVVYDSTASFNFDQIFLNKVQLQKIPVTNNEINISFDKKRVWIMFEVQNNSQALQTYFLELANPAIDSIQVYWEQDSLVRKCITTGDNFPHRKREILHHNFVFRLDMMANEKYTCYIQITNKGDALHFPIYLTTLNYFIQKTNIELVKIGLFIGLILFLILISFVTLYSHTRERTFIYFILYLISGGFFLLTVDGISFEYFWPTLPDFNGISKLLFSQLLCIFLTLFANNFLEYKHNNSIVYRIHIILNFILVAVLLVIPFNIIDYTLKIKLTLFCTFFTTIILFVSSLFTLKNNKRYVLFFLGSFFPYSIGVIYFTINVFWGISDIEIRSELMKICLILQMMIFYLALNDRIKTEKQAMQLELKVSRRKYKDILNNAEEAIFIVQNEKIVFGNKQFRTYFAHKPTSDNPYNFTDIANEEYKQNLLNQYYEHLRGSNKKKSLLFKSNINSESIWYELKTVFINWEKRPATLNFMTNVTLKIAALEEQKKLEAQLLQSQKLETIGTLAGGIAHDFNNILTPIIGYSEMALDSLDDESELKKDIASIFQSALRAKDLVKQILMFSRQIDVDKEIFKVYDILHEISTLLRATIPSTIHIKIENEAPDAELFINKTQLHQVLMNICTNAYQAISTNYGTITIAIKIVDFESINLVYRDKLKPVNYVCIEIQDTGDGIDKKEIERIFEPFFTTKKLGEGTGLGLSVAHGIIKNNGGEIFVESIINEGTSFFIFLPLHINHKNQQSTILNKYRGTERVAIISNESSTLTLIDKMLTDLGYTVNIFDNARNIIEILNINNSEWDLLITDLNIKGVSGVQLVNEINKLTSKLKVLIMTGNISKALKGLDLTFENVSFIEKPINISELSQKIRKLLENQ